MGAGSLLTPCLKEFSPEGINESPMVRVVPKPSSAHFVQPEPAQFAAIMIMRTPNPPLRQPLSFHPPNTMHRRQSKPKGRQR